MRNEFTVFFAIPFDSLTRHTYEWVRTRLAEKYKELGYQLTTIVGNHRVGPSQQYLDVVSFKNQNEDLHKQFVKDISRSHIMIADLTNDNPNVHLELGVALAMNKNILRVTGRPVEELGFDIRNLQALQYKDQDDLLSKISEYVSLFFQVKKLGYDPSLKELYQKHETIILPGTVPEVKQALGKIWLTGQPIAVFRDGGVRFKSEFLHVENESSWLGVMLRLSEVDKSGYIVRIFRKGFIELAQHPSGKVTRMPTCPEHELSKPFSFLLDIQNDEMEVKVNNTTSTFGGMEQQAVGGVHLGTFEAQAKFENIEIINRDTIVNPIK